MKIDDHRRLSRLYDDHGRRCWYLYPPYLALSQLRSDVEIVEDSHAGSVILFRRARRSGRTELEIYTPPMPFTPEALTYAMQRVQDENRRSRVRMRYVERSDMPAVARAGFRIHAREEESIIDGDRLRAVEGSDFRRIRREISKVSSQPGLRCRDYEPGHERGCLAVLDRWRDRLTKAGLPAEGDRLTRTCLKEATNWPKEAILGRVCEIGGVIRGFTFAGPISSDCGNLFVGISDTDIRGVAYLIRQDQIVQWSGLRHFNHGGDAGRSGLRALKDAFRPVEKAPVYRAAYS